MHAEIPYSEVEETREVRNCTEAVETQFETVFRNSCSITYSKECRCSAVPSTKYSAVQQEVQGGAPGGDGGAGGGAVRALQLQHQHHPAAADQGTLQPAVQNPLQSDAADPAQRQGRDSTCPVTKHHGWLFRALRAEE